MGKGEEIGDRLHKHNTIAWTGDAGLPPAAVDLISKPGVDYQEVSERLYKTQITMATVDPDKDAPRAEDTISKRSVSMSQLTDIVDRLNTSFPKCQTNQPPPKICTNSVAREPATEEEIQEIYQKLNKTHTICSGGGQLRRQVEGPKVPGYGLKCFPVIEGIEAKFKGEKPVPPAVYRKQVEKFLKTQTKASQARLDNPRILLYPERTTLMNNVERIRSFQESGATVKQKEMKRREKWYN